MRHYLVAFSSLLLATACTTNTGAPYTPSYSQARPVPTVPQKPVPLAPTTLSPNEQRSLAASSGPTVSGRAAVSNANRNALVKPTNATMRGSTWLIGSHDQNVVYAWYLAMNQSSTALLPEGEQWSTNGAVGGDTRDFIVSLSYNGPRPAITVVPRHEEARGNLQLLTNGTYGVYSFQLLVGGVSVNLLDIGAAADTRPRSAAMAVVPELQPSGDYTPLQIAGVDDQPLPAWAPSSAWADSTKLALSWPTPLPQLPALFAGMEGEQMINYRTIADPATGGIHMITDRRVTEAELRIGPQVVRITIDPDAISQGMALPPGESWYDARPLEQQMEAPRAAPLDPLTPIDWM